MKHKNDIFVARPNLPDFKKYTEMMSRVWETGSLTNNGEYHKKLESALCNYLEHEYISIQANGTLALWSAINALDCTGEIITTPFSFIATANAIKLNNCRPVFVDIKPSCYNIDPDQIERAITEKTSAILPVHCYGHPADTDKIHKLADKYKLKVVFDAAHAFGVTDSNGSILKHGDMSAVSFHATKVFSTIEGGAVICKTEKQKIKLDQLKNFGIVNELNSELIGLNAKMSEMHAAFGLLQLETFSDCLDRRLSISRLYKKCLSSIKHISFYDAKGVIRENNSYFPIIISEKSNLNRDELYNSLKSYGIFSRRYFHPLITEQDSYRDDGNFHKLHHAKKLSNKILCLPIYPDLADQDVIRICTAISEVMK